MTGALSLADILEEPWKVTSQTFFTWSRPLTVDSVLLEVPLRVMETAMGSSSMASSMEKELLPSALTVISMVKGKSTAEAPRASASWAVLASSSFQE